MTNGWTFLAIGTLISIGVFLNGWRFARMTENPWAGKTMLGQPVSGHDWPIGKLRLFGKVSMIAAPLFLVVWAALCFGWLGPVDGIQTIDFGG